MEIFGHAEMVSRLARLEIMTEARAGRPLQWKLQQLHRETQMHVHRNDDLTVDV